MNRSKWAKIATIVSISSYILAFFIKTIGGYFHLQYFFVIKLVFMFIFIGAFSAGAIGILNNGFFFKSSDDGLTPEEIAEMKKLVEEYWEEEL